jgi:serine/threonine protein kinase
LASNGFVSTIKSIFLQIIQKILENIKEEYEPVSLENMFQLLDQDGLDLLNSFLQYNPEKRISAKNALKHKYFKDFDLEKNLKEL